jgi:hypothetical protein
MAQSPPGPPQLPPSHDQGVPPLQLEWLIAAMVGVGIAIGAAGAVAFLESSRYPPAPSVEAGAHEWGTPRPRPEKPAASAPVETEGEIPTDEQDEPLIEVEISHSGSASAGSAASPGSATNSDLPD